MALYLVQHGKALAKAEDPEKGLSPEGIGDVERIAGVARGYGVTVGRIRHSGTKRSRMTAELVAAQLTPAGGVDGADGLAPLDAVEPWAERLDPADDLMVVGHLPFLERLASLLVMGFTDRPVFKLQNGGILCLDRDAGEEHWYIKWGLMPEVG